MRERGHHLVVRRVIETMSRPEPGDEITRMGQCSGMTPDASYVSAYRIAVLVVRVVAEDLDEVLSDVPK